MKCINENNVKLSCTVYKMFYDLCSLNSVKSLCLENVKTILCTSGYSGIWYSQSFTNDRWLNKSLHLKLKDIFIQNWNTDLQRTSGSNIYKGIKTSFSRSPYLDILLLNEVESFCLFSLEMTNFL